MDKILMCVFGRREHHHKDENGLQTTHVIFCYFLTDNSQQQALYI